ncbi:hypothetical protein F5J12DRAFT_818352 [Pisolithus orientalis]|uniref:uncharacterized protein n=1 Tax=Pisolithus orientalis TaxID=936130 RepID=UPI002224CF0F|nr:uncharacterized protein F5J12DRAFT_818352 [Pisolithus orientalis]KAI6012498.1 hypothetical protein F5J12DRAFT_818352 [Pisolithus orientalis]
MLLLLQIWSLQSYPTSLLVSLQVNDQIDSDDLRTCLGSVEFTVVDNIVCLSLVGYCGMRNVLRTNPGIFEGTPTQILSGLYLTVAVSGHSPSLILHSFSPSSLLPILAANPMVNYVNVLLIQRFQAAVETRTAICRTRYMIEDFMHLDFVSTPSSEDRIDIVREEYKDAL